MKGRDTFSEIEIIRIRELVNIKNRLHSKEQRMIRDQLIEMGFYISEYNLTGFTSWDLDVLINEGKIKVGN